MTKLISFSSADLRAANFHFSTERDTGISVNFRVELKGGVLILSLATRPLVDLSSY